VKGQGAKKNKCAWIVTVCDPPDVHMPVVTEVTEVLVAAIGMAIYQKFSFHKPLRFIFVLFLHIILMFPYSSLFFF
jgi:hypothetical protein